VPETGYTDVEDVLADLSGSTFGSAPAPTRIHLSPVQSDGMGIIWTTDQNTLPTQVEIWPEGGLEHTILSGASFSLTDDDQLQRVHEVRICGLALGERYHYRVGGGPEGAEIWSPEARFRIPGRDSLKAAVVGDTRGDPTTWNLLLQAIAAKDPDLILFTGDAVTTGTKVEEWYEWLEAGVGVLESYPLVPVHGNHEALSQAWFGLLSLPDNEQWYALNAGPAQLTVFNDSGLSSSNSEQATWLAETLAATQQPWKITLHHQPAFSSSDVHAISSISRYTFVPVLEAGGVKLDLAGHNHHYERTWPLKDGLLSPGGTVYIVTAGGGASLYGNDGSEPYSAFVSVTEHYTWLEISNEKIEGEAIDLAGNILDSWELFK
jgi:hypothetical protein